MRPQKLPARQAFSLLEMILALGLGIVLLLALYFFLSTYVFHSQAGRDVLAEGTIVRNIVAKISNDMATQVGPVDPRIASSNPPPASTASTTAPVIDPSTIVTFNTGIYGTNTILVLSNYRVQKPNPNTPTDAPDPDLNSDVRRTVYWLVTGSDVNGLARKEIKLATSLDSDTIDPTTFTDQAQCIFAPEVQNIVFQYLDSDGLTWQDLWDGTFMPDGITPRGAPRAIKITITLRKTLDQTPAPGATPADANADGPTYLQIVAVPTTNSFTPKLATP